MLLQDHLLRALQFLPDILKFQRLLSQKFHRRMDRSEAEKFYLGEFLKRGWTPVILNGLKSCIMNHLSLVYTSLPFF